VNSYSKQCGKKIYLIQHHEVHSILPRRTLGATYRRCTDRRREMAGRRDAVEYGDKGNVDVAERRGPYVPSLPSVANKPRRRSVCFTTIDWKRFHGAGDRHLAPSEPALKARSDIEPASRPAAVVRPFEFDPPHQSLRKSMRRAMSG
jgi:hypothetical protein